jgi:hypothetical protein
MSAIVLLFDHGQSFSEKRGVTRPIIARAAQSAVALVIASIPLQAAGIPAAPVGLLVNGVSDPLAIDRDTTQV